MVVSIVPRGNGSAKDAVEHGGQIAQDLLIANTDDIEAELSNVLVTERIMVCLMIVDAAVDLDHELARRAVEIEDEPANRVLAPEPETS